MRLWPFFIKKEEKKPRPKPKPEVEEITAARHVAGGLPVPKSRELFEVIQTREILPRLPDEFAGKMVAHLLFSGTPFTSLLREKGAGKILVGYIGRFRSRQVASGMELRFRTSADRIPLKEWCCRFALLSAPTVPTTPIGRLIRELGRIIEPGGGAALVDWHPYSAAVRNTIAERPVQDGTEGIGIEKYFKAFKDAGLIVTQVKEAFVDGSFRKLMETKDDQIWYKEHRREPYAIVFFVKKT